MLFVAILAVLLVLGFVPSLLRTINLFTKLKSDRDNRAIRQAQGQLSFDQDRYCLWTGERCLPLPFKEHTGGLMPGATYRVFYLEQSGFVLSAEQVFAASPAQARAALLNILAKANGFTSEDLASNRNGQITALQRLKPLGHVLGGLLTILIPLGIGGPIAFLVFSAANNTAFLLVFLIPALALGIFVLTGLWSVLNGLLDMSISGLRQIQGVGYKREIIRRRRGRSTRSCYYVIGEDRFQVNYRAYLALMDGLEYRLYYLPRTRKILSIEPIGILT